MPVLQVCVGISISIDPQWTLNSNEPDFLSQLQHLIPIHTHTPKRGMRLMEDAAAAAVFIIIMSSNSTVRKYNLNCSVYALAQWTACRDLNCYR